MNVDPTRESDLPSSYYLTQRPKMKQETKSVDLTSQSERYSHISWLITKLLIKVVGILLCLLSLIWMPWSIRVKWTKFIYKLTYVNPRKHPRYIAFIEETNAKYDMGKRRKGTYLSIFMTENRRIINND